MNLIDVTQTFKTDDDCLAYLETMRWPHGIRCPVCGCNEISKITRKNVITRGPNKGKPFKIIELPMPAPVIFEGQRLPASYANFYIANNAVLVPTFNDAQDRHALNIVAGCFPTREVVGIHAVDLVWGLGTLHCLSQQEPA